MNSLHKYCYRTLSVLPLRKVELQPYTVIGERARDTVRARVCEGMARHSELLFDRGSEGGGGTPKAGRDSIGYPHKIHPPNTKFFLETQKSAKTSENGRKRKISSKRLKNQIPNKISNLVFLGLVYTGLSLFFIFDIGLLIGCNRA